MRVLLVALSMSLVVSCGVRETREQIKDIEGHKAMCSWTHNNLSGNDSEETCIPVVAP